jgi:hypothetical protein
MAQLITSKRIARTQHVPDEQPLPGIFLYTVRKIVGAGAA